MPLKVQVRASFGENDACVDVLRRLTHNGDRIGVALRRVLLRYEDVMQHTPSPSPELVRDLSQALVAARLDLLSRVEYPERSEVIDAVRRAPITEDRARKMCAVIADMPFAQYAKLIEATEQMYG